ncbi:hypothetical protein ElP_72720 (plasmid) [Tautonia plasticadhaerens]|uniref:Uncharacterized protein n=1 Tax=Tautonia plasticadhaerens TaxID=2527974 RepID=A0A518HEQ2_9BACT|nr:hypothetical protein ElP_72720 [Tautonia plasticadhaerens]
MTRSRILSGGFDLGEYACRHPGGGAAEQGRRE